MSARDNVVPIWEAPSGSVPVPIETAICISCALTLPVASFNKDKSKTNCLRSLCRSCQSSQGREYYENNKAKNKKRHSEYRKANATEINRKSALYYEANKVYISARASRYRKENRDKIKCQVRRLRDENPEVFRAIERRRNRAPGKAREYLRKYNHTEHGRLKSRLASAHRRALLRGLGGSFTKEEWSDLLKRQCARCYHCKLKFTKSRRPTIDHLIPLKLGGPHTGNNIVAACGICNSQKSAKRVVLL